VYSEFVNVDDFLEGKHLKPWKLSLSIVQLNFSQYVHELFSVAAPKYEPCNLMTARQLNLDI